VYRHADSAEPLELLLAAREAAEQARRERVPVLLHLSCVRIGGHAGSDVESGYRERAAIAADMQRDPLAATMRALVATGTLTQEEVRSRFEVARDVVTDAAVRAVRRPQLISAAQVMGPLAPRRPDEVARQASGFAPDLERERVFGGRLPEREPPLTLAQSINRALLDAGASHPGLVVLGEDVARKGGVYGVTRGLQRRLGAARVVDTLLDEQSVLGLGLGAAISGLLPVPEIQYLAYLHNAEDQIRGEAATLQFFSAGAFRNPMVVRVPGLAYQKGFGGHFHNDNGLAVLRDIPGLVVACPAHPSDAAPLLRTCLAAAQVDGTVSLVPGADRALPRAGHDRGRRRRLDRPATSRRPSWGIGHAPIGRRHRLGHRRGPDRSPASATGLRMSLRTASRLADAGIGCRVVDLRWLVPLPVEDVVREAVATGPAADRGRDPRSGGISEGLVTAVLEAGLPGAAGSGRGRGLLHPARRRASAGPGLRGGDRPGGPAVAGAPRLRLDGFVRRSGGPPRAAPGTTAGPPGWR
jgi:2-oxoisovalerate dehydrogenase E1 component